MDPSSVVATPTTAPLSRALSARSLRREILARFGLVATVPLVGAVLLHGLVLTRHNRLNAEHEIAQVAQTIAERVGSHFTEHRQAISALAGLIAADQNFSPAHIGLELSVTYSAYPAFDTLLAVNREGGIISASTGRTAPGTARSGPTAAFSDRDYFQAALTTGTPFISRAVRDAHFGADPIVAVSAPVPGANGQIAAIVVGSLNLGRLQKLCTADTTAAAHDVVVLDSDQQVVFSTVPDLYAPLTIPAGVPFGPAQSRERALPTVGEMESKPQRAGAKLVARSDFLVSAGHPLWSVIVFQDTAVAFEESRSFWNRSALVAAIVALFAYLVSRRLATRIIAPMEALASAIDRFKLGASVSPEPPPSIASFHETRLLWSGLLGMAARLDQSYYQLAQSQSELRYANNGLETEVALRTSELADELERRAAAEADLRRLALVAEHTSNIVVITDADSHIVWTNPAFTRITGYAFSEIKGCKPGSFLQGPDSDPATIAHMRECLRARRGFHVQMANYAKDGRRYWLEIDAQPVIGPDGQITNYVAVETDITERRQAEAEIASYRERLELALGAANTCTWDNDLVADRLILDSRWSVMLGGEPLPVETTARRLLTIVHPDDRHAALATRRRLDHGHDTDYDVEQRVRTVKGDWLWIRSVGRVLGRDARGHVTRIIGTNTDITARKQAETQLLRQKEFLATLQRITLYLLARRDLKDVFQTLIEQATSLLCAPIGELLLKDGDELVLCAHTHDATFAGPFRIGRESAPLSWRAHDSRQPVIIDNYAAAPEREIRPETLGSRAVAIIPIVLGDACVGVLSLGRTAEGRTFLDDDLAHCTLLAQMAALVLHNAGIRETALREAADRTTALQESEARARALFDLSPVIIALLAIPEGRIIELNAAALQAIGYTREEAYGKTTRELNLWADEAERDRHLAELQTKGHVSGSEIRLRRKDGTCIHCLYSSTLVTLGGQIYSLNTVQDVSKLKRTEHALRESEGRFRAVFDESPLILALASMTDGRIVEVNAAALDGFGATREEILGRNSAELHLWVDPAAQDRYRQLLLTNGVVINFETRLQRRSGEIFTVLFSGRIITIGGEPYSLNSIQDISARTRSEAERDRTLALMHATLESTADGILVVNAEGHVETYNHVFAEMWRLIPATSGHALDEERLIPAILAQLVAPERFLISLRDLYSGSEAEVFDTLQCTDGRLFERYSHPQFIANLPTGRVWSFRDITERHRAESALRASEERFRVLADVSPVGIYSTDPTGRCTFVNRRWCEIAGLSLEQALGDAWQVALHPDDSEKVIRRRTIAEKNDGAPPAEFRFVRPDGTVTWLVGQFRAQHDTGGTIVGYVGTITDISTLKHAEAEREKMELQVRQAQKMESLGTLAGGIAHDFNNILTGILGFTDLARLSLAPGHAAHECLDHVLRSGQRARELVRQILTFSRSSHSERTRHQLHHEVAEALQLLRSTLPAMVEVEKNIDQRTPPVLADATQVHQIVMNLCTNAWQALPPRGGRLTVTLESVTVTVAQASSHPDLAPGPYVRLTVADTGSGMSATTLEHIFEPFFTTKAVGKGTGLGLAVVHGIMKSHQGAITVHSSLGVGTTFQLYFPALVSAAPAAVLTDSCDIPRGHGERILFVDDDEASGHAIERLVASLGYEVVRFTSPVLALQLFSAQPAEFGLALVDLAMPDLPGDALAENLLALRPELPVVMLTGFVEPERQAAILASGVRQVLAKPPSIPELARAIAEHLTILPPAT